MKTRRSFFKAALLSISALPLLKSGEALAASALKCPQDAPKDAKALKKLLKYDGKVSKRLAFVANSSDTKHKKFKAGSNCGNCKFYNAKKEVEGYAPCSMAANKYVPACGWCKSYKLDKKKV
ncbi:MAG: hypothetical protein CME70_22895 [Halobacteriovorax sp.]|nr:hypothetical protein [Halobacteriovorax sp.]|tara:strand:+ start:3089 stop:3454 length:366 start_codon:yes stop_codon:yes gene_type:complete